MRNNVTKMTWHSRPITYQPLVSGSACCSAALPVVLCILQPGLPAPPAASLSPGSASPGTTCNYRVKSDFVSEMINLLLHLILLWPTCLWAPEIASPGPTSHLDILLASAHSPHHPSLHGRQKQWKKTQYLYVSLQWKCLLLHESAESR